MNRRNILSISAITVLGLALVPSSAISQEKSLKDQLVGTWMLVSQDVTQPNGTKQQPLGANPKGIRMLDAGGRFVGVAGRPDRPKPKTPGQATTEETAAAAQGFGAQFGTWSVSEADKTLTLRYEAALFPINEGMDFKDTVSLTGDELKLTYVSPNTGATTVRVFRRAK
jgi:hypothetical protein